MREKGVDEILFAEDFGVEERAEGRSIACDEVRVIFIGCFYFCENFLDDEKILFTLFDLFQNLRLLILNALGSQILSKDIILSLSFLKGNIALFQFINHFFHHFTLVVIQEG